MKVPRFKPAPTEPPRPDVPPVYLAMAAAHMDKLGKLDLSSALPFSPLAPSAQPSQ